MTDELEPVAPTSDGKGLIVVRRTDGKESLCAIAPAVDGKPIAPGSQLIYARQRPGTRMADVEVLYDPAASAAAEPSGRSGPAKVATDAYRSGWDLIWGKGGEA